MQRVHLAADHAGFALKMTLARHLTELGYEIIDHGTYSEESCDYPQFAHRLCNAVQSETETGVLLCGSGIGMSMAANRHAAIRAALCTTELHAKLARRHNNANVLCLGAKITGVELAFAIVAAFLENNFAGGRHARRVNQLAPDAGS
ncbi:ribose 5-phosphate isomerase B [Candidatus Desulfovibrio trichonymphae]|uniref:Cysteinyl-tRNA synthetase n=1 Tax=Candidatus Desulfovibrio trichonymphae TaxID=1725232 RepID=A0A1J1E320_9BACT|nr:ribose 5-phosphate isomerase B [Candidatus Desulfovibrio trichonymphae]BAV91824.1 cysteinyl-tRNA synthetase [Candidatus Desulfovibrio trichonymphae]GHU93685.1 ribose 5-phosphate isomerase B [Deltaproteobacteria bacterium]GHU97858.1 ribose 5-phosphate isomerase B [Deltaproteobacteria bacterium]